MTQKRLPIRRNRLSEVRECHLGESPISHTADFLKVGWNYVGSWDRVIIDRAIVLNYGETKKDT